MKKLVIIMFMALLISCESNNSTGTQSLPEQKLETQTVLLNENIDSDFDGILDRVEIARGSNPHIADYPKLEFTVSSLEFAKSASYKNRGKSKFTYLKDLIGKFEYENYFNRKKQLLELDLSTIEANQVRCLNKFDEKNVKTISSESLKMFYELKVKDNNFVEEVSNISAIIDEDIAFELKESLKTKKDHKLKRKFTTELSLPTFNIANKCIRISDMNFNYKVGEVNLKASKVKKEIETKLAHIIILTKTKPFILSVDPNHYNMKSLLEYLKLKPEFGTTGELVSLSTFKNEFHSGRLVDFSKDKSLKLSRWFFNSSNNSQILDPLEAGEFYSLAFLSVKDLLKHSKKRFEKVYSTAIGEFKIGTIDELQVGDRVEIRLNYFEHQSELENKNYVTHGFLYVDLGLGIIKEPIAQGCKIEKFYTYEKNSFEKLNSYIASNTDFSLKLIKRSILPLREKNQLIYSFEIEKNDLKGDQLSFSLKSKLPHSLEYESHTIKKDLTKEQRCQKGNIRTNSHDVQKKVLSRSLYYLGKVSVFGPTR